MKKTALSIKPILSLFLCLNISMTFGFTNQQGGALLGAITGGIIGSHIGNGHRNTVATIVGTIAGVAVGSQWGESMDRDRHPYVNNHYHYVEREYPVIHRHYCYGNRYRNQYYPKRYSRAGSRPCKSYKDVIWIDGEPYKSYTKICLIRGKWRIIS